MNRKYIDFVPSSKVGTGARRTVAPRRRMVRRVKEEDVVVVMPSVEPNIERAARRNEVAPRDLPQDSHDGPEELRNDSFSIETSLRLGIVEDYNPKFVNTDVPKRPLHNEQVKYTTIANASHVEGQNEITEVKSKRVKKKFFGRDNETGLSPIKGENDTVSRETARAATVIGRAKVGLAVNGAKVNPVETTQGNKKSTFVPPRSPFINQEKVVKRPLSSKNVYQRAAAPTKEESKGPVAIISNSKKESKVGLVVTIVLTIILGAVAGTVAFLLLPK